VKEAHDIHVTKKLTTFGHLAGYIAQAKSLHLLVELSLGIYMWLRLHKTGNPYTLLGSTKYPIFFQEYVKGVPRQRFEYKNAITRCKQRA
jgi:hypothetical protein